MITAVLKAYSPQDNPDRAFFALTFSGTYGAAAGTGDTLNLAPISSANPGGFTDPNSLYSKSMAINPEVPPGSFSEQLLGGCLQAYLGATPAAMVARCFAANGNELAQNVAYPAAFLNGQVILEVLLPERLFS